jgi:hypothetical protein
MSNVAVRIENLTFKHDQVEEEIRQAYIKHLSDDDIHKLKLKRLALKEEMEKLLQQEPSE